ncbi:MAG: ATP-binding protein [Thiohalospira sp.]
MSLYLKYRPDTLDSIIGNESVVSSLKGMLKKKETCPHSFLLTGPTGCGKTTIGRIIAKELDCKGSDFREVDSADFRGIDTIREIRKQSQYKPLESPCKVWLIDECHKMTGDAQNALLKILEDTPKHVYFILCTTDPQKLIATIKGRCSQFQVNLLQNHLMFSLLRSVVKAEKETLPKLVYEQIIQDTFGHPRNALQVLDQVLRAEPERRLEVAKRSAEEQSQSIELCRALISGEGWKKVANILQGLKDQDAEGIRRHVLGYAQTVLLKSDNSNAAAIIQEFWEPFYNIGFPGLVFACYSVIKN